MDKFEGGRSLLYKIYNMVLIISLIVGVLLAIILIGPYLISSFAFKPLSDPRVDWQPAFERLLTEDRCTDALKILKAAHRSNYSQTREKAERFFSGTGCGYYSKFPWSRTVDQLLRTPLTTSYSPPKDTDPEWESWWKEETHSWGRKSMDVFFGMQGHLSEPGQYFDFTGAVRAGIWEMNCNLISRSFTEESKYYEVRRTLARVFAVDPERFETWNKNYLLPDWEQRYADCGEPALVF